MPRKPRIMKKRMCGLTGDQIMHLLTGWCFDNMKYKDFSFPFLDEEHRRELYFEHKEFLLSCAGKIIPGVFCGIKEHEKPNAYFDYEKKSGKKKQCDKKAALEKK